MHISVSGKTPAGTKEAGDFIRKLIKDQVTRRGIHMLEGSIVCSLRLIPARSRTPTAPG